MLLGLHCICQGALLLFSVVSSLIGRRYSLVINPLARSIEELRPAGFLTDRVFSITLRTALVASTVCIAFLLPFFGT